MIESSPHDSPQREPSTDHFPSTRPTIRSLIVQGPEGRQEANKHILSVYAVPLEVYCRGAVGNSLGDPRELVEGFFADRLPRQEFLTGWLELENRGRLRHWLMGAMSFYLKEQRRKRTRDARWHALTEDVAAKGEDFTKAIDRAFAVSLVRQALAATESACKGRHLEPHWKLFFRHYYEGDSFAECAKDVGVSVDRAQVMARTAAKRFREAMRELLLDDGVSAKLLDHEVTELLEILGS